MKRLILVGAASGVAMLAAATANAAIYTLTFTGPDFTTGGVVGAPVTQVLTALSPPAGRDTRAAPCKAGTLVPL